MARLDLNLLVVFDMLLRKQSVSRAAEALNMSQPAASAALNRLRATFEDPLFIRSSRGIQPTPRALQLAEPLQSVLDRIKNDMLQQSKFDPASAKRRFVFNMVDVGELVFLPRLLKHFRASAPNADIVTVSTPPDQLEAALQVGDVDLAVGYFRGFQSASLYQQRLFRHAFVCAMRKDHPVVGENITRKQFLDAHHAVIHPEGKSHELFERALAESALARRVVLRLPHYLAIPMILAESDLIVTVPYAVGQSFAKMGNIKISRVPFDVPSAEVKQFWHARFQNDPANRWLRETVFSLFAAKAPKKTPQPKLRRIH
ncbi:hypothetical protein BWI17_21045 [Betaproteobacteria bacterium GR16-43]|nr:hypothetical protein BWI17_21045 [Betaproteobacteria bacterium GR16-43]